ncbi:hypothetical protein, partial [Bacillus mycoides]|uniref:hypothetical protein n=1 Tax=Bacillus mycoides TaxID=1405 RepID=UPI003A7F9C44
WEYIVVVYPKGEDWQVIDVEASSKLQAAIKAVNTVMGYDVYNEEAIPFGSVAELSAAVVDLGITSIGEILLKGSK